MHGKIQFMEQPSSTPTALMSPPAFRAKSINLIQKIIGTLLYYAIVINPTMLISLGSISAQQTRAIEQTYNEFIWLLNYALSNPDAAIFYSSSNMVLHIHSDALYLSDPKS